MTAAESLAYAPITDLQRRMAAGELSAVELTQLYLDRIGQIDRDGPAVNSVLSVAPDALKVAEGLDGERAAGTVRGPLHGIPMLLKDNLDTVAPLETTAGSLALTGSCAPRDSTVAARLRAAGVVILGKANLSEWANFRSFRSSSGWSAVGGQTRNPYVLDRNPSGSSSGSGAAVAAGLCAAAIGTETNGSIYGPATWCGIVGYKPTVGLVSRAGIVPISVSQDTAGPMTRSVVCAAIVLDAIAGVDERDPATAAFGSPSCRDHARRLYGDGLHGVRLGVARRYADFHEHVDPVFEAALETLREGGADLVDPADGPTAEAIGDAERVLMQTEFKDGMARYLATRTDSPFNTLADLIAFNEARADEEMAFFRQESFEASQKRGSLQGNEYLEALARCRRLSREQGIDAALAEHGVDALVAPSAGPAALIDHILGRAGGVGGCGSTAAIAGYPHVTVPMGQVYGLPVGLSLFSTAGRDADLLRYGHAFEQARGPWQAPRFLPTAPQDV
jgi:amidase